jgi:hypothetical protein
MARLVLSEYLGLLPTLGTADLSGSSRGSFAALLDYTTAALTWPGDPRATYHDLVKTASQALWVLATSAETGADERDAIVEAFTVVLVRLKADPPYLCWVKARDGEVLNLQVTYSSADPWHALEQSPDEGLPLPPKLRDPSRAYLVDAARHYSAMWSSKVGRMGIYRRYGVAPLNYGSDAGVYATTYFMTASPPPQATVAALICDARGHHSDNDDVDAADTTFHTYDDSRTEHERSRGHIFLYVRPQRREQKVIAGGALVNLVLVFLVARGRFNDNLSSVQSLLLLTPTVLMGVISQQQRHYYAIATRRQRAVLWTYLAASALFLLVVGFSRAAASPCHAEWSLASKLIFLGFAVFSAFIAFAYALLGPMFLTITRRWMIESASQRDGQWWTGPNANASYERFVLRYCDRVLRGGLVVAALVLGVGLTLWATGNVRVSASSTSPTTAAYSNGSSRTHDNSAATECARSFGPVYVRS